MRADIYDAILLCLAFNTRLGDRNYNPAADLNQDGAVDLYDAMILAASFNRHMP